jgi:hypothetical protein
MKRFTVVGYYDDNQQPFVSWVMAEDPASASTRAFTKLGGEEASYELVVVEVFKGWMQGVLGNEKTLID